MTNEEMKIEEQKAKLIASANNGMVSLEAALDIYQDLNYLLYNANRLAESREHLITELKEDIERLQQHERIQSKKYDEQLSDMARTVKRKWVKYKAPFDKCQPPDGQDVVCLVKSHAGQPVPYKKLMHRYNGWWVEENGLAFPYEECIAAWFPVAPDPDL